MNLNLLKTINRSNYEDLRAEDAVRCDRNEKVVNWDKSFFTSILQETKESDLTAYPKNNYRELHINLSEYLNVCPDNVNITAGSDAAIRDFFILYHNEIKNIGILSDTYGMYNVYADCFGIHKTIIPYKIDPSLSGNISCLEKDKLYKTIESLDAFCFVNPNQISNDDISLKELEHLCKTYPQKKFLIDEAYYGFGHNTAIPLVKKYDNILVIRSFSKTFGLASLRLGALIGSKNSIKPFKSLATTYCTNIFGNKIANFFLNNIEIVKSYNKKVIEGRKWFVKKLRSENFKVIDPESLSVFVYCDNVEMQTKIYEDGIDNLIYLKKWKTNDGKYFIRVSCGPIDIMEKVFHICFSNKFNNFILNLKNTTINLKNDPLRYCLNNNIIKKDNLWLEFGVSFGSTLDLISEYNKDNDIYGFDTFSGVENIGDWNGLYSCINDKGIPENVKQLDKYKYGTTGIIKKFNNNVKFVKGYFNDTLRSFLENKNKKISFIHIDCTFYESTKVVIEECHEYLDNDCIIIFNSFFNIPRYKSCELLSFYLFNLQKNIKYEIIGMNGEVITDNSLIKDLTENRMNNFFDKEKKESFYNKSIAIKIFKK